ncbi:transposase [Streptosporangium sp. NPDC005286]|uniref:transposase n=1 Tax=Streptosporangium sp. NPDC005286 TaxID=3154463 RepID=UPI0033AC2031
MTVQVGQVRAIVGAIKSLEAAINQALDAHPYAALFRALPRVGTVNLAQIIGEVGPMLERGLNPDQLAAEVGMAPVTRASGKVHAVGFRHGANRPARKALTHFADNSRHDSPWAADLYRRARERGKRHPQTVRILGRGWLRVIHACFRDGTHPMTPPSTTSGTARLRRLSNNGTASGVSGPTRAQLPPTVVPDAGARARRRVVADRGSSRRSIRSRRSWGWAWPHSARRVRWRRWRRKAAR